MTSEVNRLLAELPASVHALTGVDLSKVCTFLAVVGIPRQPTGLEGLVASGQKPSHHLSSLQIPLIKNATGAQV